MFLPVGLQPIPLGLADLLILRYLYQDLSAWINDPVQLLLQFGPLTSICRVKEVVKLFFTLNQILFNLLFPQILVSELVIMTVQCFIYFKHLCFSKENKNKILSKPFLFPIFVSLTSLE